jgi:hypothetical protein
MKFGCYAVRLTAWIRVVVEAVPADSFPEEH